MRVFPVVFVVLSLAADPRAARPPAGQGQAAATAAISGVVLDGSTNRPIQGAVVALSTNAFTGSSAVARIATDAGGRFVFTGLPVAPAYYLHASKFGYFDGGYGRDASGAREARRIVLAEGQWVADADIRLWRPASVSGTVRDEAGHPVVGVIVRVLARVTLAGFPQLAAGPWMTTDDRGAYRIGGLPPGTYLVSLPSVQATVPATSAPLALLNMTPESYATADRMGRAPAIPTMLPVDPTSALVAGPYPAPLPAAGNRVRVYRSIFFPSAPTVAEAMTISLDYGEERPGVDLQLHPEPAVRVSGRVVGPPDTMAGLTVRLVPPGSEGLAHGAEVATALVENDGAFTMLSVPPGDYTLLAARSVMQYHLAPAGSNADTTLPPPPGFTRSQGGAGTIPAGPPGFGYSYEMAAGSSHYGQAIVAVGSDDVTGVVVELRPTVTLSGRLVWEGGVPERPVISGAGGGTPPPPVTFIYADPADGNAALGMPNGRADLTTGQFSIEGLRPGLYRLRVIGAQYLKSLVWNGRDIVEQPIDTTSGEDMSGVVVTVTNQLATVGGVVRDERGGLVEASLVLAFPTDRSQWTHYGFAPGRLRSASLDTQGRFSLPLPAGSFHLVAVDEARARDWRDPAFLERASRLATVVTVDWESTKAQDLVLRPIR